MEIRAVFVTVQLNSVIHSLEYLTDNHLHFIYNLNNHNIRATAKALSVNYYLNFKNCRVKYCFFRFLAHYEIC
jgi:hypothetical protein